MQLQRNFIIGFLLLHCIITKAQLTTQKKYAVGVNNFTTSVRVLDLGNNGFFIYSLYGKKIIRLNNNYDTIWVKALTDFQIKNAILNAANEIILVGQKSNYQSPNNLPNSQVFYGVQIVKINLDGTLLMSKYRQLNSYNVSSGYNEQFINPSIVEFTPKNYILYFPSYNNSNILNNAILMKLDSNFNITLQKSFKQMSTTNLLGNLLYRNKLIKYNENQVVITPEYLYNGFFYAYYNYSRLLIIDTNLVNTHYKTLSDSSLYITDVQRLDTNLVVAGTAYNNKLVSNQFDNFDYSHSFISKFNMNEAANTNYKVLSIAPTFKPKSNSYAEGLLVTSNQVYLVHSNGGSGFFGTNSNINDSLSNNFRINITKLDTSFQINWTKRLHIYGTKDTFGFSGNFSASFPLYGLKNSLINRGSTLLSFSTHTSNYSNNSISNDEVGFALTAIDTNGTNATCNATEQPLLYRYDSIRLVDKPTVNFQNDTITLQPNNQLIINETLVKISEVCLPLLKPKSKFFWYPEIYTGFDNIVCKDSKINLFDRSYNEPKTWKWIFPPQVNITQLDSLYLPDVRSISFNQAGTFPVSLVTNNDAGSDTTTQFITVINFIPQPNLGNDTTLCNGDSLIIIYKNPPNSLHYFTGPNLYTPNDTLKITTSGQYIIAAYTACGYLYDTINVGFAVTPQAKFIISTTCNSLTATFTDSSLLNFNPSITHQYSYKLATAPVGSYTNFSTLPSPIFTFPSYDSFTVRLIVTSALSCVQQDTFIQTIYLQPKPTASFNYTNSCGSLAATFTGNSTIAVGTIAQHRWFYNGVLINTNPNFTYNFTSYGSYTIQYVTQGTAGCVSDTATQTVVLKDKPIATLTYNNNACATTNFIVTANSTVTNATITNHQWLLNGVAQTSNSNSLIPNLTAGNYTLQYISNSNQGCSSDTVSKLIEVQSKPNVNFSTSNGCVGTPITFTNSSTNAIGHPLSYTWLINGSAASTATNLIQPFTSGGNYAIQLKATTPNGCTDSTTKTITIETQPIANFRYDSACLQKPITFTSTSTNATGAITGYNWTFNNGQVATTPTATTSYTIPNNYTVTLRVVTANGCSQSTAQLVPITAVQLTATNDTTIAANQPLQLQAVGAATYLWSPSFGLSNPTIANPIAVLTQAQQYQVKGVTASGCVGYANIAVQVYKEKGLYIPTIFTPNNDGVNDVWKIVCSGVRQLNYLKVYNRWGQLVHQQNNCTTNWNGLYQNKPLPIGAYVYFYEIIDFTNQKITGKGTVVIVK